MPTSSQIHVDSRLSNVSFLYSNQNIGRYIGAEILPISPVMKKSDEYTTYTKSDRFTLVDTEIGRKGEPKRIGWSAATSTYSCQNHALEDEIPLEDFANADDVFDLRADTTEFLTELIMTGHEKRVADLVFDSSVITQGTTLAGTDQWSDYTNSDPIQDIETALDGTFIPANSVAMGWEVWLQLKNHPDFVERFIRAGGTNGTGNVSLAAQVFADMFNIENVYIGRTKYNTALPGATPSYSRIWGKKFLAFYKAPRVGRKVITLGYTFSWTAGGGVNGYRVSRYEEERPGLMGAEVIKVAQSTDEEIVASDLGYLITDAVA